MKILDAHSGIHAEITARAAVTLDPRDFNPFAGLTGGLGGEPSAAGARNAVLHLRDIGIVIFGIGTVTAILFFLIYVTKLGAAGDDPAARKTAITGILVSGLALSLLGGCTTLLSLFWNLI